MPAKKEGMTVVEKLEEKLGCSWQALRRAKEQTEIARERFRHLPANDGTSGRLLIPEEEASIVVFGSLARGEWTDGSDVDWTLLIDGPADPEHRRIAHIISTGLKEEEFKKPGPTGVFGNMAFSHDIIHQIGGQKDTNENTTRRILLLLESLPIVNDLVYDRVTRAILKRYLEDDISFLSSGGKKYRIPRFLLNDIVRYWRTMAVDYAHKRYERAGQGWALRNIKLRMSRKLIFVSGLLTCFSCYLDPSLGIQEIAANSLDSENSIVNHLMKYVRMTPLEVVADALFKHASEDVARCVMNAYDKFIEKLACPEARDHLEKLEMSKADTDDTFNYLCETSREFQKGLTSFFFDGDKQLSQLTRKYGVF
jgi:predicted nucleotidyltransferase